MQHNYDIQDFRGQIIEGEHNVSVMFNDEHNVMQIMYTAHTNYTSGLFTYPYSSIPLNMNVDQLRIHFNNIHLRFCDFNFPDYDWEFLNLEFQEIREIPVFNDGYHLSRLFEDPQNEDLPSENNTLGSNEVEGGGSSTDGASVFEDNSVDLSDFGDTNVGEVFQNMCQISLDSEEVQDSGSSTGGASVFEDNSVDLSGFGDTNVGEVFQTMCEMVQVFV